MIFKFKKSGFHLLVNSLCWHLMVILPKSVADFVRCEGVFLNHGNISLSRNSLLKRSYHIFLIGHLSDSFTFSAWQCLFMLLILLTCCFLETIDRSPVVRWSPLLSVRQLTHLLLISASTSWYLRVSSVFQLYFFFFVVVNNFLHFC